MKRTCESRIHHDSCVYKFSLASWKRKPRCVSCILHELEIHLREYSVAPGACPSNRMPERDWLFTGYDVRELNIHSR